MKSPRNKKLTIDEEWYQSQIPHFCKYRTVQEHINYLMGCWSLFLGRVGRANIGDVEGPHFCHNCDLSVRTKRWDKKWHEKFLKKEA